MRERSRQAEGQSGASGSIQMSAVAPHTWRSTLFIRAISSVWTCRDWTKCTKAYCFPPSTAHDTMVTEEGVAREVPGRGSPMDWSFEFKSVELSMPCSVEYPDQRSFLSTQGAAWTLVLLAHETHQCSHLGHQNMSHPKGTIPP